eukprot:3275969-Karenia_brevis.AAC.1
MSQAEIQELPIDAPVAEPDALVARAPGAPEEAALEATPEAAPETTPEAAPEAAPEAPEPPKRKRGRPPG